MGGEGGMSVILSTIRISLKKNPIMLALTLKSMTHFELIFTYDVR